MITATDIQNHMRAVPFVPFRVTTSSGQTHDITHPEMAYVTRRYIEIGVPHPDEPTVPDKITFISILHITGLETFPQPAPSHGPGANGSA